MTSYLFTEHLLWAHPPGHHFKCPPSQVSNGNGSIWSGGGGRGTVRNGRGYGNWREHSPPEKRAAPLSLVHGFQNMVPWTAPSTSLETLRCRFSGLSTVLLNQNSAGGILKNLCFNMPPKWFDAGWGLKPTSLMNFAIGACTTVLPNCLLFPTDTKNLLVYDISQS